MGNILSDEPVEEQPPKPISVEIGEALPGETRIRRNGLMPQKLYDVPFEDDVDVNTALHVLRRSARYYEDCALLGQRPVLPNGERGPYEWETYGQVYEEIEKLSAAIGALQIPAPGAVGIFSINRPEWFKSLFAIWGQGHFCVPLYDTLGANAVSYILAHADVSTVFVAQNKFDTLIKDAASLRCVKNVIMFEEPTKDQVDAAEKVGWKLVGLKTFENSAPQTEIHMPAPENLAYLMYTSGTTGNPKGVRLSHRNILASASGIRLMGIDLSKDDVHLSFLPLAHSMETCIHVAGIMYGCRVGFYQGDVKKLMDDVAALRPTLFCGVPRVFSRVYDRIWQTVNSGGGLKKAMFENAFKMQSQYVQSGTRSTLLDSIVFGKVKARLGGRVRMFCSGAAPLPAHIMLFLKTVFGVPVYQGYGMTENAAAAVIVPVGYEGIGTVGAPLPCTEVKLIDVPDMNYFSTDKPCPRGEVLLRGPNVFSGYHKLPKETEEALDKDGWLHTGDVGQWNPDGSLQIIDRKKNIFKLAQGEFVAAEELEAVFSQSKLVGQIFVYGNSFKTSLVAVVVPNMEEVVTWGASRNMTDAKEIASLPDFKTALMADIVAKGKQAKLASFKIPKDIFIETTVNELLQGFTIENGCLTPTFKPRRPQLLERYKQQIDAMYDNMKEGE